MVRIEDIGLVHVRIVDIKTVLYLKVLNLMCPDFRIIICKLDTIKDCCQYLLKMNVVYSLL